ncbi:MAG: CBS domain-containing protein, partial [Synergistales bacterium]|nr:CBS domain-containing protein [Synergistales bacterium]
ISPESPVEILVQDPVIKARSDSMASELLDLMEEEGCETAQVVDKKGKWRGMALLWLIKRAARSGLPASDGITRDRKLQAGDSTLRDAAEMLADQDLPIPVISDTGDLLGVVTQAGIARLTIGRLTRKRREVRE